MQLAGGSVSAKGHAGTASDPAGAAGEDPGCNTKSRAMPALPLGTPRQFLQVFCLMLETGMLLILL